MNHVDAVLRDVRWAKVSPAAAEADYGVVLSTDGGPAGRDRDSSGDSVKVDIAATEELRARLRAARQAGRPFFDRGPGYAQLSGGAPSSDYDHPTEDA